MSQRQIINIFIFQLVQADILCLCAACIISRLSVHHDNIEIFMPQHKGIVNGRPVVLRELDSADHYISIPICSPCIGKQKQIVRYFLQLGKEIVTVMVSSQI